MSQYTQQITRNMYIKLVVIIAAAADF